MSSKNWMNESAGPRQKRFEAEDNWCGFIGGSSRTKKKEQNMRLLGNKLAVRVDAGETETPGGLVLPHEQESQTGTIVSVGNSVHLNPGDKIIFSLYAGVEVPVNGETLRIMSEDDVLVVFD